ncbi:MAG: CoA-binding protein [Deltaproteobacteria bacterium]|nr:MAG: CoA-binding protein [Deltaproteobacteria bacterium]
METDELIHEVLETCRTVAVYGMSQNPEKPAHYVPLFLATKGFDIIPINLYADEIIGRQCYSHLMEILERIEILQVFRPSDQVPDVMEEVALRRKEKGDIAVVWLQEGIKNRAAQRRAEDLRIAFVQDRCMQKEFKRIFAKRR